MIIGLLEHLSPKGNLIRIKKRSTRQDITY